MESIHKFNIGLKLWSRNHELLAQARELYEQKVFQYIELYAVPGTFEGTIKKWRTVRIPFAIHCPHSAHGFNLAKKEARESNRIIFNEVKRFADELKAQTIVVHGGNNGPAEEACSQLLAIQDQRIFLENKPKIGMKDELCVGFTAQEIRWLRDSAGLSGIVLDFGHVIYAAKALQKDPFEHIKEFLELKPTYFHLGDGDQSSKKDVHFNFGKGNFDIARLVSFIPKGTSVTIETPMGQGNDLRPFVEDVLYLREISAPFKFRPAINSDSKKLFDWKNDIEVKKNSFHSQEVSWQEHRDWFMKKLKDENSRIYILFSHTAEVGQIRFDRAGSTGVIDISIDSQHRLNGYGSEALRKLSLKMLDGWINKVTGYVKKSNAGSYKSFKKAGFKEEREEKIEGFDCYVMSLER